jgi:hypothetical protein
MNTATEHLPPWHIESLIFDAQLLRELLRVTRVGHEMGGLLLGDRDRESSTVRVLGYVFPAQHRASAAFCEFAARWIGLIRAALISLDMDQRLNVVAWVHTHPRLSVFLSGTDVDTITALQRLNPLLLAVVLDPYAETAGAFHLERHRPDTPIGVKDLNLDGAFVAELHRLLEAPQLREAVAINVVRSPKRRKKRVVGA